MNQAPAAPSARVKSPWPARVGAGLFAMPVGVLGLAGAWRRLAAASATSTFAELAWKALATLGVLLIVLIGVPWLVKRLRHGERAAAEAAHPVQGALVALAPVSMLLAIANLAPELAARGVPVHMLVVTLLAWQAWLAVGLVRRWRAGVIPPAAVTPALYLPPVAGGLVGAMAAKASGLSIIAPWLWLFGVIAWIAIESRVVRRLRVAPLPEPARPTIGVELAPIPVATLSATVVWPGLPAWAIVAALAASCVPAIVVGSRRADWLAVPFSAGFWSFSFPAAAVASCVVEAVRRGDASITWAWIAVAAASAVIAYLAVRTLLLLGRGQLLPAA